MRYEIKKYGDPVLRKSCKDVTRNDQIEFTIRNMWETLDATTGVGIAAPQCGFDYRIFLIKSEGRRWTIINPEILEHSDEKMEFKEGCLSIPGVFEKVIRSRGVRVRFLDDMWEEQIVDFVDMPAIVFQHEFDHLRGKLFIDRLSPLKKKLIQGKLKKIEKHA